MRLFWSLLLVFVALESQAQTFDQPLDYLNFLNQEFVALQELQIAQQVAMIYKGETAAEQERQRLLKQANAIHQRLQRITPYTNDHGMLQEARRAIVILRTIGQKNYEQQAAQKAGCTDCFATMLKQVELIQNDEAALETTISTMIDNMRDFAADHNIRFSTEDNPNNALLHRIQRLNNYLQTYNLAISETQYANNAVIDALNTRDIDAGKAATAALLQASANAVQRLSKTGGRLTGDSAYFTAARKLIDAYRKAAQYIYPKMFEAFDPEGHLPNDQVDAYNKNIQVLNTNLQTLTNDFFAAEQTLRQQQIPPTSK